MNLTPEQLREIYSKLPQNIKDAFSSAEASETVQRIGKMHELSVEQMGKLAGEIGYVMIGASKARDFVNNLSSTLKIPVEKAYQIAVDINTQIFAPIRESLKKLHGMADGEDFITKGVVSMEQERPGTPTFSRSVGAEVPPNKEEILKELEGRKEELPAILQGSHVPMSPFEAKTKETIFRAAPETSSQPITPENKQPNQSNYTKGTDPYREPVE